MIQPKFKTISVSKDTFLTLFLILFLVLIFMPFLATFNDLLTRLVINLKGYSLIRDYIVPAEVQLVAVVLAGLGFDVAVTSEYVVLGQTQSQPFIAEIVWNCIGWQSLLFFIITTFVGLQGDKYTNLSKFKAAVLGALGTFLINIFRIVAVVLVAFYFGQYPAIIIHDYGSILAVIAWLFFFWWFAYNFVLESKEVGEFGKD